MGLDLVTSPSTDALLGEGVMWAQAHVDSGRKVIWVCSTVLDEGAIQRYVSKLIPLGVQVSTLSHFVADLWELEGDDREVVNSATRDALIRATIIAENANSKGAPLAVEPRFVRQIAQLASRLAGQSTERSEGNPECQNREIVESEEMRRLVGLSSQYHHLLNKNGFIEEDEALLSLNCFNESIALVFQNINLSVATTRCFLEKATKQHDCLALLQYEQGNRCFAAEVNAYAFLEQLSGGAVGTTGGGGVVSSDTLPSGSAVVSLIGESADKYPKREKSEAVEFDGMKRHLADGTFRQKPSDKVGISLAIGPHVEALLLVRTVRKLQNEGFKLGDIALLTPSGTTDKETLRAFSAAGIPMAGRVVVPLERTAVGKLISDLFALIERPSYEAAVGFICNPLSCLTKDQAWELEWSWRVRPSRDTQVFVKDVCKKSSRSKELIEAGWKLHEVPRVCRQTDIIKLMKDLTIKSILSNRILTEEELLIETCAAWRVIERTLEQTQIESAPFDLAALQTKSVSQNLTTDSTEENEAAVHVVSVKETRYRRYPAVVLCKLDRDQYPMASRRDPVAVLLDTLGKVDAQDTKKTRLTEFYNMLDSCTEKLIFERTCNDRNGEPCAPAFIFREALDVYREDDDEDENKVGDVEEGIPNPLLVSACIVDEGDTAEVLPVQTDEVYEMRRAYECMPVYLDYRQRGTLEAIDRLVAPDRELSPTEIESYLVCPYRWFLERRINPICMDTTIAGITRGNIFHKSLEMFYRRFTGIEKTAAGTREERVSKTNIGIAQEIMCTCVDEYVSKESNHVYPMNETDRQHIRRYALQLAKFLEREPGFLPGYHPTQLEYGFGTQRGVRVRYAGVALKGSIDRIDIKDDANYAFIIDYKASDVKKYSLSKTTDQALSPYVQAAIYASVYGTLSNADVVGTCYRSILYKDVVGAWGQEIGDPGAMGLRSAGEASRQATDVSLPDGVADFKDYLCAVENYVGEAIVRMQSGDIRPNPASGSNACRFCGMNAFCEEACSGS